MGSQVYLAPDFVARALAGVFVVLQHYVKDRHTRHQLLNNLLHLGLSVTWIIQNDSKFPLLERIDLNRCDAFAKGGYCAAADSYGVKTPSQTTTSSERLAQS